MSSFWQKKREAFQPQLVRFRGQVGLRTFWFLFRRRLPVFSAILAAVGVATAVMVQLSEPLVEARAEVLLGGPSAAREVARIRSQALAGAVAARLGAADRAALAPCPRSILPSRSGLGEPDPAAVKTGSNSQIVACLKRNVSVAPDADTLSLTISYAARSATAAASAANAYAAAYTGGTPGSGGVSEQRIISSATVPAATSRTNGIVVLLVGLALGTLLGAATAVVTELRFGGLTTGTDVQARLWVRHLGSVPDLASVLPDARSVLDAIVDHPQSGFVESFRNVIRAARGADADRGQVLAITSSVPGEGATTVAMAMARTLALGRRSVVLVDCDARHRISRMFGVDGESAGLSDVIAGRATLADALFDDAVSGAMVLPEPPTAPGRSPTVADPAMSTLIKQLRARFDLVLVAVGPVGRDDARWLGEIAQAVILVSRWRSTPDTTVATTVKRLQDHDVVVAGVVLNRVDMRRQVHYTDDEVGVYQKQFAKYFS